MSDKTDKRIILIIACMAAFITPFLGRRSTSRYRRSLGVSCGQFLMNWVVLGFLLSAAIFVVPFGRIADIIREKNDLYRRPSRHRRILAAM